MFSYCEYAHVGRKTMPVYLVSCGWISVFFFRGRRLGPLNERRQVLVIAILCDRVYANVTMAQDCNRGESSPFFKELHFEFLARITGQLRKQEGTATPRCDRA